MSDNKRKVALVSSHGGHLTELLALKNIFNENESFYITYDGKTPSELNNCYYIHPRWFRNPILAIKEAFNIYKLLSKEKPNVIFSTGAEIALPVFFIGKLFFGCKLIYLECSAQVTTPSLTGRILYYIADLFLVQWKPLLERYGKRAEYRGGLI